MTDEKNYYEVDIEYTTGAKMVLLGNDEDEIRSILTTEFDDVPNLTILSIRIADPELVEEAKAYRADLDTDTQDNEKKVLN